jgi:hypothetical protein
MISFYDVNIQYNLDELRKNFESIERKKDFIDSEEYLHQAQKKRVSQYYVKSPFFIGCRFWNISICNVI